MKYRNIHDFQESIGPRNLLMLQPCALTSIVKFLLPPENYERPLLKIKPSTQGKLSYWKSTIRVEGPFVEPKLTVKLFKHLYSREGEGDWRSVEQDIYHTQKFVINSSYIWPLNVFI